MTTKRQEKKQQNLRKKQELLVYGDRCLLKGASKDYHVEMRGIPECTKACPAGIDVKAYIKLIANRKFEEAVSVIRESNPFPAVCGRICTRPCEKYCELDLNGDAIFIRDLKRYAADYELSRRTTKITPCEKHYDKKIAVIGSGPSGLTAAVDLTRLGYSVTVFEEKHEPGGMLRYGIPSYRLPKRILKKDIEWIQGIGVNIKTRQHIGDPASLLDKGYNAVLIACGAPKSFPLGIKGENSAGVIDALWFLREVNSGKNAKIKGNVVVIGGGSTAFDVARSSIRLGAQHVTIAYRRGLQDMPADQEEIEHAKKEKIEIQTQVIPNRIIVKDDQVAGIEFLKTKLGKKDKSGRRTPQPITGSEFIIKTDYIIPAIGAMPDVGTIKGVKVTTSKGVVDVSTYGSTSIEGIYAAGDVEMGPSSVVDAIGRGHQAAKGIHAYLSGSNVEEIFSDINQMPIVLESSLCSRSKIGPEHLMVKGKVTAFSEVKRNFTDFEAVEEASRCFTCGPCTLCPICLPSCPNKQVIAETKNTSFLLKVPASLSSEITHKGPVDFKVQCDTKITPITLHSLTSYVDTDKCLGCGRCEELCAYRAIRNIITKDKRTTAHVFHDVCSSCSACVSACPSGAISQGYMSDKNLLSRLQETQTRYKGVKALMSFWSTTSPLLNGYNGVVEIMSVRKISPSFLIKALARTKKGLLIIGPDDAAGSHYLPWEEQPSAMLERAQLLLRSVGISPERIRYKVVPKETKPTTLLKEFSQFLYKKHLDELSIPEFLHKRLSPLGETMILLRIMGAHSDIKPYDEMITNPIVKSGGTGLFEGCLPMLHMIGETHKLFDLHPTRKAIRQLLEKLGITYGFLPKMSCPSKGLLNINKKEMKTIVDAITQRNKKAVKKYKPKQILITTPEAYSSFSQDETYGMVQPLPRVIIERMKKTKKFSQRSITIALHNACAMDQDPFYEDLLLYLQNIPGISIVELKGNCQHHHFEQLDGDAKLAALYLMEEAKEQDAEMIICTSPYCQAHLLLCQRKGSWRSVDIEISDIYSFFLQLLIGDMT